MSDSFDLPEPEDPPASGAAGTSPVPVIPFDPVPVRPRLTLHASKQPIEGPQPGLNHARATPGARGSPMKYKLMAALVTAALGWSVWAGVISTGGSGLSGHDLEIDVPADPEAVAEAVGDLEADGFAKAIGAPDADATAEAVYLHRNPDGWSWLVRGDSGLAVQLDVVLEPLSGGGTRVRTRIVPGRLSAPALELAQKLELRTAFADGIRAELDPLLPADRRLPPGEVEGRKRAARDAIATVQAAASPWSVGAAGDALVAAQSRLEEETPARASSHDAEASNALAEAGPAPEVSFEPGQPMVDVGRE